MPRYLVVGNGKCLVNLDQHAYIRDIYYPFVGQLNHVGGYRCRFGVWVDGVFSWLHEEEWQIQIGYVDESLVTETKAHHPRLQLTLTIHDAVHQRESIFLKRVHIQNHISSEREVRLFFHQDLVINETEVGDTAVFYPLNRTVFHYKKDCYFMFNGCSSYSLPSQSSSTNIRAAAGHPVWEGIFEYTTGIKRFHQAEGTWKDAEDGHLMGNDIAQGSVDSTISLRSFVPPLGDSYHHYWFSAGKHLDEVIRLDQYVRDNHPGHLLDRVETYWRRWVNKDNISFANLDAELIRLYKQSLLIVRTQTDVGGAIIAANDTDIMQFNRDHYSYMWPRDGALVAKAMSSAGYHGMIAPFFRFCAQALTSEGYLHHKYNPDGTVGSSWHPYIHDGKQQLPIQEDETALVLHALWHDYTIHGDVELAQSLYQSLIRKAAKFLLNYQDERLQLPHPSYDLWEERYGIFTFTASAVYGGLTAAAEFAALFGDDARSERYAQGAERIKQGIVTHLWNEEHGRFARSLFRREGRWVQDMTPESSIFGIYEFGVLPPTDRRVVATMNSLRSRLSIRTPVGGIARYWQDYYFQRCSDLDVAPGNPWVICTLWFAGYDIATATTLQDLKRPLETLQWVQRHSLSSGLLSEQVDPHHGQPISVAPLTWSHATYVDIVLKYIKRYEELQEQ
ncbi:glycoside hydrolase family 15 protein [Paenibacillus sp. ACRRX]|uniref:glycoside hydrolase family 15 protein n=1 Tax=unclassified Paenibacillus TaxID=185978 RepID=UPI001EF65D7B|nr:glycoside hydrolase family 15 protein [Paenibacillus sp. UMB4589-SE434]MCG7409890.1 glycoside hydrolase family 15 protein [Paenibacillus sp. ACRRX]MDK8183044.1 glycoside hydrolase family 15 protein [Paenibacillus sp. UMB4589-SE434]